MNRLGLYTGEDIRNQTIDFLEQHFGVSGRYYYGISRGIDYRQIRPDRERKSIGAENTFFTDTTDFDTAWGFLEPLIDKVWRYVETNDIKGRTVTLKVKFSDFRIITRSRSGLTPVADKAELTGYVRALLEGVFPVVKGIRLLGVSMSSLGEKEEKATEQLSLSL